MAVSPGDCPCPASLRVKHQDAGIVGIAYEHLVGRLKQEPCWSRKASGAGCLSRIARTIVIGHIRGKVRLAQHDLSGRRAGIIGGQRGRGAWW